MLKRWVAGFLLCLLCACGGGGGGGGGLALHFAQTPFGATFYEWDIPDSPNDGNLNVIVNVTVSGSTSAPNIYVVVTDVDGTFEANNAMVTQISASTYALALPVVDNLALGTHTGTINVKLCSDVSCAGVLLSHNQAYRVVVAPNPTLQVTAAAPLVGKALAASANNPAVAGFLQPELTFQGAAQLPAQFRSGIFIKATDPAGRVSLRPPASGADYAHIQTIPANNTLQLDFQAAPDLAAGSYSGVLELQVCRDGGCERAFTGTSSIAYQLDVVTANVTALTPVPGAPDWQGEYGNSARTSYVPITVDPAAFAPRWRSKVAQSTEPNYAQEVVTGAGRVFVRRVGEYNSPSTDLYALNESDGSVAWQKNFTGGTASSLLAANGNVYLRTAVYFEDAVLRAHAVADGAEVFAKATESHYASSPPVAIGSNLIFHDTVSTPNGHKLRLRQYDGATGDLAATPACLTDAEVVAESNASGGVGVGGTPPTSGTKAYVQMRTGLHVVDFGAAPSCATYAIGDVYAFATAGAVTANERFIYTTSPCSSDVLRMFEPGNFNSWSFEMGNCNARNAAIRNGVVYALNGSGLEARDEAAGTLLWSTELFRAFGAHGGYVLVTDNVVFVFSGDRVLAVDLTTHKVIWTLNVTTHLPPGGWALSSSGVLYLIDKATGLGTYWSLIAINLR